MKTESNDSDYKSLDHRDRIEKSSFGDNFCAERNDVFTQHRAQIPPKGTRGISTQSRLNYSTRNCSRRLDIKSENSTRQSTQQMRGERKGREPGRNIVELRSTEESILELRSAVTKLYKSLVYRTGSNAFRKGWHKCRNIFLTNGERPSDTPLPRIYGLPSADLPTVGSSESSMLALAFFFSSSFCFESFTL